MSKWIPIARVDDDLGTAGLACEVGGELVALFRVDGRFHATSNVCTHQFALLTEGHVDGEYVVCPMHQGRFHIPTGKACERPVSEPLACYPVKVEGDQVLILLAREQVE